MHHSIMLYAIAPVLSASVLIPVITRREISFVSTADRGGVSKRVRMRSCQIFSFLVIEFMNLVLIDIGSRGILSHLFSLLWTIA